MLMIKTTGRYWLCF